LAGILCSRHTFVSSIGGTVLAGRMPLIEFICDEANQCPSGCRCVYRPANATLHVYCSSANFSSLPLRLPPLPKSYDRYKLEFSNNKKLQHLEHRPYFVNTSILDVSDSGLTEIDLELWNSTSHMKVLNFRGNKLQNFQFMQILYRYWVYFMLVAIHGCVLVKTAG